MSLPPTVAPHKLDVARDPTVDPLVPYRVHFNENLLDLPVESANR
jgi:hypothetical protein